MDPVLVVAIVLSETVALVLAVRMWLSRDYVFFKVILTFILIIPLIGPVLYFLQTTKRSLRSAA